MADKPGSSHQNHDLQVYQIELEMQNHELRRIQTELELSRQCYFDLYELAPVGYCTLAPEGHIRQANLTAARFLGQSAPALVGQVFHRFVFADDQDVFHRFRTAIMASGQADDSELRLAQAGGPPLWVKLSANITQAVAGEQELRLVINDISERKQTELELARLAAEAQRFRAALEQVPSFIYMKDDEGRYVYANPATLELFACTAENLPGRDDSQFFPPETAVRIHHIDQRVLAGEKTAEEVEVLDPDGQRRIYWELKSPLYGTKPDTGIWGLVGVSTDITARKLAEEKIKLLLAEKEVILREVHHRIKNNMSTVYGLLLLQAESLPEPCANAALQDAAARVRSMMLLYDKLYQSTSYSAIPVRDYLSVLIDEIMVNFPGHDQVRVEKTLGDFTLESSRLQVLGIIINELLTNIMKYAFDGRSGARIRVVASLEGERVTVAIEDNGNGLPESIDFKQSTGFGLKLVEILSAQLGGAIRIVREQGTCFLLEFNQR